MTPTTTTSDDATAAEGAHAAPRIGRARRAATEVRALLEFLALTTIAMSVPLFDSLQRNVNAVFAERNLGRYGTWVVVLTIAFGPAAALWLVERIVAFGGARVRRVVHAVLLGGLVALVAAEAFARTVPFAIGIRAVLAVAAGVVGAFAVLRWSGVRSYLRILSASAPVFVVLFLASDSIAPIALQPSVAAARDVVVRRPKNVVMIVMDELSTASLLDGSGRVDAGLFPNFAALAGESTWYRNTTSVAPYTEVALPAMLTGRYPPNGRVQPIAGEYPDNLFTLLGRSYDVNVREIPSIRICPESVCGAARRDVAGALSDSARLWWYAASGGPKHLNKCACDIGTNEEQMSLGNEFVRSLAKAASRPRLDFLHVILPHAPWRFLPTGQQYSNSFEVPFGLDESLSWKDGDQAQLGRAAQLLQLQAADRLLGSIVSRLRQLDAYRDSLVVVTADHGVAFTPGASYRSATPANYDQVMWVPLFVKQPGAQAGTTDDRIARTIDLLPTIADALDADVPWRVDGRSLLGPATTDAQRRFMNWGINAFDPPAGPNYYATYDGVAGFAKVLATPAWNPSGAPALRAYGVGRYGGLVGRDAGRLSAGDDPAVQALVVNAADYMQVDPTAAEIPAALLRAGLSGRELVTVAVAVNGTIGAVVPTTQSFALTPQVRAYLPPQLFRSGVNDIQLYRVDGPVAAPVLRRLPRV